MNGVTWCKPHAVWIMLYHILTSEFGLAHAPCILDLSFSVKYSTISRYIPKRCNLITTFFSAKSDSRKISETFEADSDAECCLLLQAILELTCH